MTDYTYDPTGTLPANLITGETHSVTEANFRDYYLIIPTYAPFFINNLTVTLTVNNVTSTLVEGVDYSLVLFYLAASRSLGIPVYGAISLNNTSVSGQITVNYQTIGDPYIADKQQVLAALATYTYNPRITSWDIITNVQEIWPPNDHNQDASTLNGMIDLVTAINSLATSIGVSNTSIPEYIKFITNPNNPTNVTATQIGLGLVQNLPLATNNQILNEIPANVYVTLAQVLQLLSQASYIIAQLGLKALAFLDKADLTLNVTNVLPPTNGGLGAIDLVGFIYGNGINPANSFTVIPTINGGLGASNPTGYAFLNGTNPATFSSTINLQNNVSSILNPVNGGLGASNPTGYVLFNGTNPATFSTTIPHGSVNGLGNLALINSLNLSDTPGSVWNILTSTNGGTGASNPTGYSYFNGPNPATFSTTIPTTNITGLTKTINIDKLVLVIGGESYEPLIPTVGTGYNFSINTRITTIWGTTYMDDYSLWDGSACHIPIDGRYEVEFQLQATVYVPTGDFVVVQNDTSPLIPITLNSLSNSTGNPSTTSGWCVGCSMSRVFTFTAGTTISVHAGNQPVTLDLSQLAVRAILKVTLLGQQNTIAL